MKESILRSQFSVLVLKPEFMLLSCEQQQQIWDNLKEISGPNILDQVQKKLSKSQAIKMWNNIHHYPWSGNYYEQMCRSTVTVVILEGQDRAKTTKHELRSRFSPEITELTNRINAGYKADIFHGSDPGQEKREVKILRI